MSYVEARRELYVPLYAAAVMDTPAFARLKALYDAGECLRLYDFDGFNLHAAQRTYEEALNDVSRPFGHGILLCALLEGVDVIVWRVWEDNRLRADDGAQ